MVRRSATKLELRRHLSIRKQQNKHNTLHQFGGHGKEKVTAKVIDASDLDDDDSMDPQHLFVIIAYGSLGIEPFSIILEIANQQKGTQTIEMLCLFCCFLMLRRRLSSTFVAERCATTPFLI